MKRIGNRSLDEALDYHRRRDDTPNFTQNQRGRVELAHFLIDKILDKDLQRRPLRFVEIGCGSGDITGPYSVPPIFGNISFPIEVIGIDVVPQAAISCAARWPNMTTIISPIEEVEPIECDLLVMCEVLEHLHDPVAVVQAWLPKAKWAVIGHPLDEPDPPYEIGHNWSYTLEDWERWFPMGNHQFFERFMFPMAAWHDMVMGHSARLDQPAWRNVHPDG
jgi:trans-aconitate methyltransferase